MYYWDPENNPVLTGNDTSMSSFGGCSKEYSADYCGQCFYGHDKMPSSEEIYSFLFTCVDIPGLGQKESVWFLAKDDLERGSTEMDEWLSMVTPHVHEILPVNRMSQLMVQKHTSDCVFRID